MEKLYGVLIMCIKYFLFFFLNESSHVTLKFNFLFQKNISSSQVTLSLSLC